MKKNKIKILLVVGARPNMMKAAPLLRAFKRLKKFQCSLVHTGQHYDFNMSGAFFRDLGMPKPHFFLKVGAGSHAVQTARIMERFEKVALRMNPHWVIVVGDVNSTLACALVASKLHIKVAHVEAGLRSFDRTMPEEINRILTDHLSDILFTTSPDASKLLKKEGIPAGKIFCVGDVMIDSLLYHFGGKRRGAKSKTSYALMTLHRPSNVDNLGNFKNIFIAINEIAKKIKIIFPVHPRTKQKLRRFKIPVHPNIQLLPPQGYLDFIKMYPRAKLILTDSGSIQTEASVLNIPCLTLRENTERPITLTKGTNILVGVNPKRIVSETGKILRGRTKKSKLGKFWDGCASERIGKVLIRQFNFNGRFPGLTIN